MYRVSILHDVAPKPDRNSATYNGTIIPGIRTPPQNTATGSCSSGNNYEMWNDGTTGKRNASLGFDGADDTVVISSNNIFDLSNGGTLSAWVYPNSFGETYWENYRPFDSTSGGNGYFIAMAGGPALSLTMSGVQTNTDTDTVPYSQWTHVLVTFDGSNWNYYLNGKLNKTQPRSTLPTANSGLDLTIGNRTGATDRTFNGLIDDVKIFNYALTPQQIILEYNSGAVRF